MAGVFKNMAALVEAIRNEMIEATNEVVENSYRDLDNNVDYFYNSPEGQYHRTGQLKASPQIDGIYSSGNTVIGQISISTGTQYSPAGRDTETIYGYAENNGLIGNGGFWAKTEEYIPQNIQESFGKRFH